MVAYTFWNRRLLIVETVVLSHIMLTAARLNRKIGRRLRRNWQLLGEINGLIVIHLVDSGIPYHPGIPYHLGNPALACASGFIYYSSIVPHYNALCRAFLNTDAAGVTLFEIDNSKIILKGNGALSGTPWHIFHIRYSQSCMSS